MPLRSSLTRASTGRVARSSLRLFSSHSSGCNHEPLRILFCGSDAFSIYSLNAVNAFRKRRPDKIKTIDVLCRPDKRVGRGPNIQAVPIKHAAHELDLPLYQLDSFRGWKLPSPAPNLVVTASFGLLVPARVLENTLYGGINVHPSLLPDLRGAAPIQHAILQRMKRTGVSIQTMHPTKFDFGTILAQKAVYIEYANQPSTQNLIERLGPLAADLLVESIDHGLFIEPQSVHTESGGASVHLRKAPKITTEDRQVQWQTWTADELFARDRALGQLWDTGTYGRCSGDATHLSTRMLYDGPWKLHDEKFHKVLKQNGNVVLLAPQQSRSPGQRQIAFRTADNALISPSSASIASKAKHTGLETLQRLLERRASSSKS